MRAIRHWYAWSRRCRAAAPSTITPARRSSAGTSRWFARAPSATGRVQSRRKKRWQVRVKRSAQELRLELRQAQLELTQRLARSPRAEELARHLGVSDADVLDAQRADMVFQASSLDAPVSDGPDTANLADLVGADDPQLEHTLDMEAVWTHWRDLPERQQRLLMMRFYGNMTQTEIGERLGVAHRQPTRIPSAGGISQEVARAQSAGGSSARSASIVTPSRSWPRQNSSTTSRTRDTTRSAGSPPSAASSSVMRSSK